MEIDRLKKEQTQLASLIVINKNNIKVETIGGCDVVGLSNNEILCCIVVVNAKTMEVLEKVYYKDESPMKQIPGYQGFREGPIIVNTFTLLKNKPDTLLVKGHGIDHPRRCGIASQIGLQLDIPTIGIGIKPLLGRIQEGKVIIDDEIRALLYMTREHANPIVIAPGHKISLSQALEIIKNCVKEPHKLPEPIFLAHKLAKKKAKDLNIKDV